MLGMEGFIGITTARLAGRGITITAWEKLENVAQIYTSSAHREAMKKFWSNLSKAQTLAYGFHTILTRCMCVILFATK